jgi:hypothetical protein
LDKKSRVPDPIRILADHDQQHCPQQKAKDNYFLQFTNTKEEGISILASLQRIADWPPPEPRATAHATVWQS